MSNTIQTPSDFGKALRQPYAWPGGYPLFFVTRDCAALCHQCARKEGARVTSSIREQCNDGWQVVAQDVNWEDCELYCDHCGKAIESAYGERASE